MTNWVDPPTSFILNKSTHADDRSLMARKNEERMPHIPHFPQNKIPLTGQAIIAQLQ